MGLFSFPVSIGERNGNLTFGAGPRTRAGPKQPPKLTIRSDWKFSAVFKGTLQQLNGG